MCEFCNPCPTCADRYEALDRVEVLEARFDRALKRLASWTEHDSGCCFQTASFGEPCDCGFALAKDLENILVGQDPRT
jgi:hypothetical protein